MVVARRHALKWLDPTGEHNTAGADALAVLQLEREGALVTIERLDRAFVDVRHRHLLDPRPVGDEVLEQHRLLQLHTIRRGERGHRQWPRRFDQVRRAQVRAQHHALGHRLPERQRASEQLGLHPGPAKVRRGGQAVWPSADHRDLEVGRPRPVGRPRLIRAPCERRSRAHLHVAPSTSSTRASAAAGPLRIQPSPDRSIFESARRRHQALTSRGSGFHALSSVAYRSSRLR